MNGVQTRFKCKLDVKRCKRFVFPPSSLLPRSNALKTKAIRYFQTDRTLTRIVSPPLLGAPEKISLTKLFSLHRHEDEGVKYFSGTATYKTNFVVKPSMMSEDRVVFLDLGAVEVMAEVIVNGVNKGIFWSRPYLIDVTDVLKPGENTLEIKVTNQWTNRLIGDEQLPEENEYVPGGGVNGIAALSRGAIRKLPDWYRNGVNKPEGGRVAFTTWKHYRKDSPLIESGLIGPVRLIPAKKIEFE